ncbi:hypothetical protein NX862_13110 [Rhodobacter sp. KR11]|uniref:hypothetical protein n=1 Tax=Rhodobacter sp. KR11 TaxID=2974588 RepID=UPI0022222A35|nr:hypothetical protein [Rhodobacter sp. KR11]MCW1919696.1 hypothetical protein [Rhodobacter sp. KR11]
MTTAGYSGTPLAKKLGLKDGQAAAFVCLPDSLQSLTEAALFRRLELAPDWRALPEGARDVIHLFTTDKADLVGLPVLRDLIAADGMIWVSWPKKASKVPTTLTEDLIRSAALDDVLVDVKVCAVDAIWSGLKLVVRKDHRARHIHAGPKGGLQ